MVGPAGADAAALEAEAAIRQRRPAQVTVAELAVGAEIAARPLLDLGLERERPALGTILPPQGCS